MSVVVVGSANLDVVCRVSSIPAPGETVLARSVDRVAGGKGSNQALAAARSGADTTFVCALGQDPAGAHLRAVHQAAGVQLLNQPSELATGFAHVAVSETAENSIVVFPGANAGLRELSQEARNHIKRARIVLLQLEIPLTTVQDAARAARAVGALIVLNASPVAADIIDLLPDVDVLLVNDHEAAQLASALEPAPESCGELSPTSSATRLSETGATVIVTLGAAGSLCIGPQGQSFHVPSIKVQAVDTTGAGDTFAGAFAAALDRTREIDSLNGQLRLGQHIITQDRLSMAIRWASAAAALAVQVPGAEPSIPHRDVIEALLLDPPETAPQPAHQPFVHP